MKKNAVWMAGLQIFLQSITPLIPFVSAHSAFADTRSPFSVDRPSVQETTEQESMQSYASALEKGARLLTSDNASDSARSLAVGAASSELQQWMSQYGTARIQLNMDRHGSWSHSSGDLLFPVYDNQAYLFFVQGGLRKPDDRLTGNLGIGLRHFQENSWMFGANAFYDNDFTGHNRRLGIGGEIWRNYLRLSVNGYLGTSEWHTSRDFDSTWQEKPANGYDVRAQAWLPAYPQLGAKLIWEHYYGDRVALFDKDHLLNNPQAITAGVDYTPVPLLTLGVDHKQGASEHDTQISLGLHWRFGEDWRWQLDPANVHSMRTLAGSRLALVDRNNEIVLQYRKNAQAGVAKMTMTSIVDYSPADGVTRNVLQVLATNRDGQPVAHAPVSWSVPSDGSVTLLTSTTVTDANGYASLSLTSTQAQTVQITAQSNNVSALLESHFIAQTASQIALTVGQNNATADGSSVNTLIATLTDNNGLAVAGQKVSWTLPEGITLLNSSEMSDANGQITLSFSSLVAGNFTIKAVAGSLTASATVTFSANSASAKIDALTITTDGSLANGQSLNIAQVIVTDASGNALSGQTVTWSSSSGTVKLGESLPTDASGKTTVSFSDSLAETVELTATLVNGNSASTQGMFITDQSSIVLRDLSVTSGAAASGSDVNTATVSVTDANGAAMADVTVTFSVSGSAKLSSSTVKTNSEGNAVVTLTDSVAETVNVEAKLTNGSSVIKESSFTADLQSAQLTLSVGSDALADGLATSEVAVALKDKNGLPLAGEAVTLAASGSGKLSTLSATTDSAGEISATLTDSVAEAVTVTVTLSNGKQTVAEATFIDFGVTSLETSTASVKANGTDSATLTAVVVDAKGQVVANTPVSFSVSGGAQLSATTVMTNSNGQAQVTLTHDTGETVTVTAKTMNSQTDSGKTTEVQFIASTITGLTVNGTSNDLTRTFSADSGFPQTGFTGASFSFLIDNGDVPVTDYNWSSNQNWVSVNDGTVTFVSTPSSSGQEVVITATPKTGKGTLTWTFKLAYWFTFGNAVVGTAAADSYCSSLGQWVPPKDLLDYTDQGTTRVGSLWSEWANSIPQSNGYDVVWAAETGSSSRYYMFLADGHVYANAAIAEAHGQKGNHNFGAACVTNLN